MGLEAGVPIGIPERSPGSPRGASRTPPSLGPRGTSPSPDTAVQHMLMIRFDCFISRYAISLATSGILDYTQCFPNCYMLYPFIKFWTFTFTEDGKSDPIVNRSVAHPWIPWKSTDSMGIQWPDRKEDVNEKPLKNKGQTFTFKSKNTSHRNIRLTRNFQYQKIHQRSRKSRCHP